MGGKKKKEKKLELYYLKTEQSFAYPMEKETDYTTKIY